MNSRGFLRSCALLAFLMTGSGTHAESCWLELYDDSRKVTGAWSGSCKDDKAYGNGVAQFSDGGTYRGDAQGGRAHGRGEVVDAEGDRYEGEFAGGRRHGVGTQSSPNGRRVTGRWHRGKLVEVYESSASPESQDVRWGGAGAQDGAATEGAGSAALPAVRCKLAFAGMSLDWTGPCKDGRADGEGRATAPDGSTYAGSASQGKPHGHGTVKTANGGYYQGAFRNGLQHGWALVRNAGGRMYRAEFRDGQQVGKSILAEGVADNDPWKDPWKEESGEQAPWAQENKFAADSGSTGVGSANSGASDSDQEGDPDYRKAVRDLNGEDGVVRVAIPDDEYTAGLTGLERRQAEFRAAEIENESRRNAEEAVRRDEEEAAEQRRAARQAEKSRQRAALERKAHEALQSEREEARRESKRKLKASTEKTQKMIALQQRLNSEEARCDERFSKCSSSFVDRTGRRVCLDTSDMNSPCKARAKSAYQSALHKLILNNQ